MNSKFEELKRKAFADSVECSHCKMLWMPSTLIRDPKEEGEPICKQCLYNSIIWVLKVGSRPTKRRAG